MCLAIRLMPLTMSLDLIHHCLRICLRQSGTCISTPHRSTRVVTRIWSENQMENQTQFNAIKWDANAIRSELHPPEDCNPKPWPRSIQQTIKTRMLGAKRFEPLPTTNAGVAKYNDPGAIPIRCLFLSERPCKAFLKSKVKGVTCNTFWSLVWRDKGRSFGLNCFALFWGLCLA